MNGDDKDGLDGGHCIAAKAWCSCHQWQHAEPLRGLCPTASPFIIITDIVITVNIINVIIIIIKRKWKFVWSLTTSLMDPRKKLKGSEEEEQQDKCASLSWTADLCEWPFPSLVQKIEKEKRKYFTKELLQFSTLGKLWELLRYETGSFKRHEIKKSHTHPLHMSIITRRGQQNWKNKIELFTEQMWALTLDSSQFNFPTQLLLVVIRCQKK